MMRIAFGTSRKALAAAAAAAALVFAFSAVRLLSGAVGVADPTVVSVRGADGSGGACPLELVRVTRRGGEAEMTGTSEASGKQFFSTDEWTRGFLVRAASSCVPEFINVSVGGSETEFVGDSVAGLETVDGVGNRSYALDGVSFGRSPSRLRYFSKLLNWPGDARAFLRVFLVAGLRSAAAFLLAIALILWFGWVGRRFSGSQQSDEDASGVRCMLACALVVLLAIASCFMFFRGVGTAFGWPAMDMAPFWMRLADPGFALGSYFTNISMEPNPRWVFGFFVIGLAKALGTGWYEAVFTLRILFTMFVPVVIFLSVCALLRRKLKDEGKLTVGVLVAFGLIALLLHRTLNAVFALGMWSPLVMDSQPEVMSLLLSFGAMGLFLTGIDRRFRVPAAVSLLFLATLFHPVRSLCVFAFFAIADHDRRLIKEYTVLFFGGVIAPAVLMAQFIFPAPDPLSAQEFVYHYIKENHDFHYLPSNFGAVFGIPWFVAMAFVVGPLSAVVIDGFRSGRRELAGSSLLLLASYVGSIVLEYLFVELYPVKIFAIVTPVRYTAMGYWMVVLALSWWAGDGFGDGFRLPLPRSVLAWRRKFCMGVALGLAALFVWSSATMTDDPWVKYKGENPEWGEWLDSSTTSSDVFASNILSVNNQLLIVYGRPSFLGNGFPFREDDFVEYDRRKDELFGSYGEWESLPASDRPPYWSWSREQYRNLTPQDFLRLARKYRIDYVIVENDYGSAFADVPIEFENDTFKVYKVKNFR